MSKLSCCRPAVAVLAVLFPAAAWADLSANTTLSANTRFSFDTGATVTSGGDILFTGTSISLQGSATAYAVGALGASSFSFLTQATLSSFGPLFSTTPITGSSLAVNEVFAVHTIGGHYAAVLITAVSNTSLTLKFSTFGVTGVASGPSISMLQNNYSYILPGLPNYGIAPGSLFLILGTGLSNPAITTVSALQNPTAPGIPLTLNGASVSVTVGSVTTHPGFYYAIPTALAVVLPSNTPVGTGTISVTYNNLTGTAPIQVVTSALGLDTLYGTGVGLGVATVGASVINYNASASPGQVVTLWGSGLGADTADSDTVYTVPAHSVNVPLQIYIGGIQATISYQGGSGYPGVNQINVQIPQSVQPGCGVSVVAVSGTVVSNTVTLPVSPGGGVCSDSALGYNGNQILTLGGKTAYSAGSLIISQGTFSGTTNTSVGADFFSYQGAQSASGYQLTSIGSCIVSQVVSTSTGPVFTYTGLDAGTITVTGPSGTTQQLATTAGFPGVYSLQPSGAFIPATGGTFTFKGTGGKDVGPFTASLSYANPLSWTNMNAITTINRAQGVTVNWTGGAANTYVYISGSSTANSVTASFTCYAPVSAGQFTVPSYVLLALPASSGIGGGSLLVENVTAPQSFTASGLDYGNAFAAVYFSIAPSYQ